MSALPVVEHPTLSQPAHVDLEVRDLTASISFYSDLWGLEPIATSTRVAMLAVRGSEEPTLLLREGEPRLRAVRFHLAADVDVDVVARSVAALGGDIHSANKATGEGEASALRFSDPFGHEIEVAPTIGPRPSAPIDADGPLGIDHVVLEVDDPERAAEFYRDALGFRVSDVIPGFMTFLRSDRNHHRLALKAGGSGLDHVAYTVSGWSEIANGLLRLGDKGVQRVWGPGRHGPGNNLFAYFADPDGNVVEYTAEVAQIDDDGQEPGRWTSDQGDLWPTT